MTKFNLSKALEAYKDIRVRHEQIIDNLIHDCAIRGIDFEERNSLLKANRKKQLELELDFITSIFKRICEEMPVEEVEVTRDWKDRHNTGINKAKQELSNHLKDLMK